MFKATRELIKLRQPHSNALVEKILVRQIVGGQPRRCYENACWLNDIHASNKVVSGWLVNKWDKSTNSCLIVSHYWNINPEGDYVDCSPKDGADHEYVIDSEIGVFASLNYDKLFSSVCSSIVIKESSILGVDFREEGKVYRTFKDFSINSLFSEFN
jgi:hypothetical protein